MRLTHRFESPGWRNGQPTRSSTRFTVYGCHRSDRFGRNPSPSTHQRSPVDSSHPTATPGSGPPQPSLRCPRPAPHPQPDTPTAALRTQSGHPGRTSANIFERPRCRDSYLDCRSGTGVPRRSCRRSATSSLSFGVCDWDASRRNPRSSLVSSRPRQLAAVRDPSTCDC